MSENWHTIGHAVRGRGHELDDPPIPCQDKINPSKPTTYNPSEVAIIALADGAGSAKFSHLGAEETLRVVTQDLRENFTRYTHMAHPREVSSAILGRVLQTLQEFSIQKTNALQRDKSDIEGIFQALLEEIQAIQNWQAEHRLPLVDTLQTLQKRTHQNHEKRKQAAQQPIQQALVGMGERIKTLQRAFQGEAYQLDFNPLKDTLEKLEEEIKRAHLALFSEENFKELFKQLAPIEKQYYTIKDKIDKATEKAKSKRKGGLKRFLQSCLDLVGLGSDTQAESERVLNTLENTPLSKPSSTPLTMPSKALKDYNSEQIQRAITSHKNTLKQQIVRCFESYQTFLDRVERVDFKEWDEESLDSLSIIVKSRHKKLRGHLKEIRAQIQQANKTTQAYKSDLLNEIHTKEQERARLKRLFGDLKRDVLHLEQNLNEHLDKLQTKLDSLSMPYTWQTLQGVLLATKKENLQKDFKLYEDYAAQSSQLNHGLKALSLSLPGQVSSPRAFSGLRDGLEKHREKSNNPQQPQTPPTREVLIAPKYNALLDHIKTLETQARDFQNMQEHQKRLEAFQNEVATLEKTLKQRLDSLGVCCDDLQACVQQLQEQTSWRIQDLRALNALPLDSCINDLEKGFEAEKALVERFKKEFQESSPSAPRFKFTLQNNCQRLQQVIQNKACDLHDLASTLLVVAIKDDAFLLLHLGDGICGVLKGRELKVASHPDNGEFSNETIFTTSKDAALSAKVFKGKLSDKNFTGFVLMSDGAGESFYKNKERTLVTMLQDYMNVARAPGMRDQVQDSLKTLLKTRVKEKTTDDCSVIMLVKESVEPLSETERKLQAKISKNPPSR
ncbi:protein phosphatase 2C domain-containing protein [Helicobacter bizzozeronii]|uniref:protein phosphatase 2C domain-containing protein n=1 Tax=Helicobacter bizzozeronii TaxID=56877 RepID=UPI000CF03EE0|nr:protein phosphatase 2C domain-containing protein [Helicobacter bizzozeronii]